MDVIDLREFYAQPLGRVVRRIVSARLRKLWPDLSGLRLAGLGFATPYLNMFANEALLTAGLMPAAQGVVRWPVRDKSSVALVEEVALPLADDAVERLLIVHGVEMAESLQPMLREAWRVLAPGGRLIIVAANRAGLWARVDATPFGHGRPFSRRQLIAALRQGLLSPTDWSEALFMPPFRWAVLMRAASVWERIGAVMWPGFSGVVIVEAVKEVYAVLPRAEKRRFVRLNPAMLRGQPTQRDIPTGGTPAS
ncbi:MAG: class I SAM-dependent methyltransferase [Alphaproteobacteria bacterium]